MRRAWLPLVGLVFSLCAFAQEAAGAEHDPGDPWLTWKWVNFAILAAGLGYLISRSAGAFFRSRTEVIQKGITEASKLKQDAEARASEIERKMAGLGQEIDRLRTAAKEGFAAEGQRIEQETGLTLRKIQRQAEQEIASASKNARLKLKAYAAKLALDLAEQQVRSGMTPEVDRRLLSAFVQDLSGRTNGDSRHGGPAQ